jgi:hypothetical protein
MVVTTDQNVTGGSMPSVSDGNESIVEEFLDLFSDDSMCPELGFSSFAYPQL